MKCTPKSFVSNFLGALHFIQFLERIFFYAFNRLTMPVTMQSNTTNLRYYGFLCQ